MEKVAQFLTVVVLIVGIYVTAICMCIYVDQRRYKVRRKRVNEIMNRK